MSPETATHIDGLRLVRWLEDDVRALDAARLEAMGDRFGRMIRGWKEGRVSSVYAVDETLCALGVCLGEVPAEFYCEDPRIGKTGKALSPEKKASIVKLCRLDWTRREVACILGVDATTVERHMRKAATA
jgi:hypothetical protein